MIALLVHYSGRVQGVGFRATGALLARAFDVTGWVKNLPDGRVALWVEGEEGEAQRFLAKLRSDMSRFIRDEQQQAMEPSGHFTAFNVTH